MKVNRHWIGIKIYQTFFLLIIQNKFNLTRSFCYQARRHYSSPKIYNYDSFIWVVIITLNNKLNMAGFSNKMRDIF